MNKLIIFFRSIFLQLILSIVALLSWINSNEFGNLYEVDLGTCEKKIRSITHDYEGYEKEVNRLETFGTGVTSTSGFIGGSIAMGLICSVCIVMIVWLEINKKSKS